LSVTACLFACYLPYPYCTGTKPPPPFRQVLVPGARVALTLMFNTSAIHALPAALSGATSALLRAATGDAGAHIAAANHPMPTLPTEPAVVIEKEFSARPPRLRD